jgi:hypothetical protein
VRTQQSRGARRGRHRAGLSVMGWVAATLRFQQDALDHGGIDIVGFQVFNGRNGIGVFLDANAMVDDVALAQILALVIRFGDSGIAKVSKVLLIHITSLNVICV